MVHLYTQAPHKHYCMRGSMNTLCALELLLLNGIVYLMRALLSSSTRSVPCVSNAGSQHKAEMLMEGLY